MTMKYILDDIGYIEAVSYHHIECDNKTWAEYTGAIPEGYDSLDDWILNANIRAYKIVSNNLTYDAARDEALQNEWECETKTNSITALLTPNPQEITYSTANKYVRIELDEIFSEIGKKIIFDTEAHEFVIGKGVSKVKISGQMSFGGIANNCRCVVRKHDGTNYIDLFHSQFRATNANYANTLAIPTFIADVKEGDKIYMVYRSAGTGTANIYGKGAADLTTYMTIEEVSEKIAIETIEDGSGGGGGTTDYRELLYKPSINGITLNGNKTTEDLGITIPTKTSELTNDSNFLTTIPSEYITETELNNKDYITETELNSKGYLTSIPSEYVTETELNSKGYLTEHQDISNLATKAELNSKANASDLANKQDKLVSGTNIKTINGYSLLGSGNITIEGGSGGSGGTYNYAELNNKPTINNVELSGNKTTADLNISYNDLKNKPTIPTKTSELTNDSDFTTASAVSTQINEINDTILFIETNTEDLAVRMTDAEDNINGINESIARVPVILETNGVSSYECYYIPATGMIWCSLYITGKAFTTGTRHVVATAPEAYRPSRRVALAMDGLQDYASATKSSISSSGEIGFTTSVAKEAADDLYISGFWFIE